MEFLKKGKVEVQSPPATSQPVVIPDPVLLTEKNFNMYCDAVCVLACGHEEKSKFSNFAKKYAKEKVYFAFVDSKETAFCSSLEGNAENVVALRGKKLKYAASAPSQEFDDFLTKIVNGELKWKTLESLPQLATKKDEL